MVLPKRTMNKRGCYLTRKFLMQSVLGLTFGLLLAKLN